jgi:hypothetical protein
MSDSSVPVNKRLLSWLIRTRRGIAGSESIWLIPILRASGSAQLGRGTSARSGFADQSCPSVRGSDQGGNPSMVWGVASMLVLASGRGASQICQLCGLGRYFQPVTARSERSVVKC